MVVPRAGASGGPLSVDGSPYAAFGAGGSEPYARALGDGTASLELRDVRPPGLPRLVDVARFGRAADGVDRRALSRARGSVLDVGCGPGRMVAAALARGLPALGVDVSRTAVQLARATGLPVLRGSVFDPLPLVGVFATVLLLDGNIGIGGSPDALLVRCAQLLSTRGNVVVEVEREPETDQAFIGILQSQDGRSSDPFPWAEVGQVALARHARRAGLTLAEAWSDQGRSFVDLERARGRRRR